MMTDQPIYHSVSAQSSGRPQEDGNPYSLPYAGVYQAPLGTAEGGYSPMASFPTVPPHMPLSMEHGGPHNLGYIQAATWPIKTEVPEPSIPLPMSNAHVRNGQPTPPPFNDGNGQPSNLGFHTLAQYQVDGFQAANVPVPPSSSFPLAPASYGGNVEQSPPAERKSRSPPPPRRLRNATLSATKNARVEKESASRSKFLERNRLAASKCRQKKKDQCNSLQAHCQALEATKHFLQEECERLTSERIVYKNVLFEHVDCGSKEINAYLQALVRNVTSKVTGLVEPPPGAIASELISTTQPDTSAFGFDGPMQFSPSDSHPWDETARRNSIQSMATDYSLCLADAEPAEEMQADIDFDSLLDVTECA